MNTLSDILRKAREEHKLLYIFNSAINRERYPELCEKVVCSCSIPTNCSSTNLNDNIIARYTINSYCHSGEIFHPRKLYESLTTKEECVSVLEALHIINDTERMLSAKDYALFCSLSATLRLSYNTEINLN